MTNDISSTRRRAIAVLVAAFIGGAAVGAFADRAYVASRTAAREQLSKQERRNGPRAPEADQIPIPLERLDLTVAERDSLRAIARRWRPQAGEALGEFRRRVGSLENYMFADMLCVLTPDQRARYKAQLATSGFDDEVTALRFKRVNEGTCGK